MIGRRWRWVAVWSLVYAAMLASVIWSMFAAQRWALEQMGSKQATEQWETWREDVARQQTEPGPIQRRIPPSEEPPALVLMRDYFATCLLGAIVVCTLLMSVLAWFAVGALNKPPAPTSDS